eukprot:9326360-Pyramimonas_sp.AAC.1
MRFTHPVQRFVAPWGAPPKVQVLPSACVLHTQYSFSGPIGSPTEGPSATVRMRPAHPVQRFMAP